MKLGYYVKRTDTGRTGQYPAWYRPRPDGMALVYWDNPVWWRPRKSGDVSLISVKYLTRNPS